MISKFYELVKFKNKIIHILIDNYIIDNHSYTELPLNQKCENFSLDISFICIPEVIVGKIEGILKTYQIMLNNIVSSKYIERYLNDESVNYFHRVSKIIDGHNKNEFKITNKTSKNMGFFEKFFNLFGWLYFPVIFVVFQLIINSNKSFQWPY